MGGGKRGGEVVLTSRYNSALESVGGKKESFKWTNSGGNRKGGVLIVIENRTGNHTKYYLRSKHPKGKKVVKWGLGRGREGESF